MRVGKRLPRSVAGIQIMAAMALPIATAAVLVDHSPAGASKITPTAYVTNWAGGSVTPIDLTSNTSGTGIPVGNELQAVAINPTGRLPT